MKKPSFAVKKIVLLSVLLLFLLGLTGCITEKNREKIVRALERYDVIKKDWEFLGYRGNDASPIPDISSYSYYYQDSEGNLFEVCMQNKCPQNEEHDEYYPVTVIDHMEAYENEEFYTDPDYEERQRHIVTRYRETDKSDSAYYKVMRKKLFIIDVWVVRAKK